MDEFVPHSGINWQGDVGVVQYGPGDNKMIVMFYLRPQLNPAKSEAAGRQIFEDVEFVRIHPPGERLNIIDRRAGDVDKKRWPMQWAQFKQNAPQMCEGTPIEMLYPSQPSIGASLKASGVHTVEQCAELSAHAIETIGMGCQQWVNEATRYLQVANKGVKASEMKKMLEDRDRQINSLNHKLGLLETELERFREKEKETVTLADVQQMIANQGGGGRRAVYPGGKQLNPTFDAQSAQIAATHTTRDLAKGNSASSTAKRQRARIT